jgi:hypothetical protein
MFVIFSMYPGVSGEGKVLDGVIFEDGLTVVRWVTVEASQSTNIDQKQAEEAARYIMWASAAEQRANQRKDI